MILAERLRSALARGMAATVEIRGGDAGPERPPRAGSRTGALPGIPPDSPPMPAAVLVAITDRPAPGVILTQRPDTMRNHAGQVAFPGGRVDPGEDAVAAALREAQEEIALDPAQVDVIGTADPYLTVTNFRIVPVLGVIPPDLPLRPTEAEVAAVFETPLAWLLDPANHGAGTLEFGGQRRHFIEMHWQDRRIWGATAAMIVNLSRRLAWLR